MEGLVTEAARALFSQGGLMGALLVLSGVLNWLLYREVRDLGAGHLAEVKALATARLAETRTLVEAIQAQTESNRAVALAMEGGNRAAEARTRTTEELARQIAQLAQAGTLNDERAREKLDELLRLARGGHS